MVTFPHGETNVTLACQNRCVSCNHFIPVQQPWFIDPADFVRDLRQAAKVMHFQVYNLVGGEPTLHPRILDLIDILRQSGITDRVEITSNGQAYRRWPGAFYQAIDDLIVTPYKLDQDDKATIAARCAEWGTHLEWHPVIFTWAAYKQAHSPQHANLLYRTCWYAANRNVIDDGHFYRCCIGRFIPSVLLFRSKRDDALPLEGLTEAALTAYLHQAETPAACSVCASNAGAMIPWREQADPAKWIEESLG